MNQTMHRFSLSRTAAISALALAFVAGAPAAFAQASGAGGGEQKAAQDALDLIIFRDGRTVTGKVMSETSTSVKVRITVAGISAETEYNRGDILAIQKGQGGAAPGAAGGTGAGRADPVRPGGSQPAASQPAADGKTRVYVINMTGEFGEDITQTPVREAVRDARTLGADVIVCILENDWSRMGGLEQREEDAETGSFDDLFRAEAIAPIFVQEIPTEWEKQPKVVFWVKQAMGGAAFLPFISPTIYMAPDARWGGIGNLATMFGGTGDEVVRQKQMSLRLGHAEGLANVGGYDYRIIRAMADIPYELSVRFEGGRAVLLERGPQDPSETLLTDNGRDANEDTIRQRATGEGNDVLTLRSALAKDLGISKGTVSSMDDLMFELGLQRDGVIVEGRSKQITEGWSRGLDDAQRNLIRIWREYGEVEVAQPGGFTERTRARGQRRNLLENMLGIYKRFGEGLTARWRAQNGIPSEQQIGELIEQIRFEQLRDRR